MSCCKTLGNLESSGSKGVHVCKLCTGKISIRRSLKMNFQVFIVFRSACLLPLLRICMHSRSVSPPSGLLCSRGLLRSC